MTDQWHVLGAGSIGGLFACRLSCLQLSVTLLSREPTSGQRVLTLQTEGHVDTFTFNQESIATPVPITHLLVCTKAFDVIAAVTAARHRLAADATVVLLANGMGYHDPAAQLLPGCRVIAGSTTAGVSRPAPDRLVMAGTGTTDFGPITPSYAKPDWFNIFENSSWSCRWRDDMRHRLLLKLSVNALINPMTALYDISNGAILEPPYRSEAERGLAEVCSILVWANEQEIARKLPNTVLRVAQDTADNISSMRADIQRDKPTEVDAILGYLLRELAPTRTETAGATPAPRPETPLLHHWLSVLQQRSRGS